MAEITVKKEICQNCGADVRPNTLFCYNCGSSVAPATNGIKPNFPTVKDKLLEEERSVKSQTNHESRGKNELETAASATSAKQKNKPIQKKTTEVIWEEPESAPNLWFLIVAFLLTIFAVVILVVMRYVQ